jgi:peptide/nickel transport system substrate-binding protein
MRWTKVFLLALVAGLFAVPGVVQAQGRADALVVVTEVGPNMLDIHAPGANRPSYQSSWNIYDRLLTFGSKTLKDGSRMYDYASLKPELAESWQVAPDGMSVTFKLRKDAKFHDGSPVTAHDVKWSFDRAVTVGGFPTFQMKAGSLEKPEQFEVVDDYTFRVKFVRKDKLSMPDLGVPVAVVINSKLAKQHATPQDPWAVEWVKQNDAGAAPTRSKAGTGTGDGLRAIRGLEVRPLPKIRRVIVREIPSAGTRRAMLEKGDADISFDLPRRISRRSPRRTSSRSRASRSRTRTATWG